MLRETGPEEAQQTSDLLAFVCWGLLGPLLSCVDAAPRCDWLALGSCFGASGSIFGVEGVRVFPRGFRGHEVYLGL